MKLQKNKKFLEARKGGLNHTNIGAGRDHLFFVLIERNRKMNFPITIKLAGVTFGDAQKNIKQFGCRDIMTYALIREPANAYDPNAIQVSLFGIWFMGYVPKEIAKDLAPLMDAGRSFLAYFVQRNESPYHKKVGMIVLIVETTEN